MYINVSFYILKREFSVLTVLLGRGLLYTLAVTCLYSQVTSQKEDRMLKKKNIKNIVRKYFFNPLLLKMLLCKLSFQGIVLKSIVFSSCLLVTSSEK